MKKQYYSLLLVFCVFSVVLNVLLFFWGTYWKNALVNQFITTSDIEKILVSSGNDLSIDSIKNISINLNMKPVIEVNATPEQISYGADKNALRVNNTILLFKDGLYNASKSIND